jgi:hypothetical protein
MGFLFTGHFGKVGRGGQHALLQRQYSDTEPWSLSFSLERSFTYYEHVMALSLRREVNLYTPTYPPIVVASDGRLDDRAPASVAVLIVDIATGSRKCIVAEIPQPLIDKWSVHEQYIALVEQAAVVMGVFEFAAELRQRDVIWFEDNSVVLSGLAKGSNHGEDLDAGCACIHLALAMLKARSWWEYVESKANWSDGASRLLEREGK